MPTSADDGYPVGKGQQLDKRADNFQTADQGPVGTGRPSSASTPASAFSTDARARGTRGPPDGSGRVSEAAPCSRPAEHGEQNGV